MSFDDIFKGIDIFDDETPKKPDEDAWDTGGDSDSWNTGDVWSTGQQPDYWKVDKDDHDQWKNDPDPYPTPQDGSGSGSISQDGHKPGDIVNPTPQEEDGLDEYGDIESDMDVDDDNNTDSGLFGDIF